MPVNRAATPPQRKHPRPTIANLEIAAVAATPAFTQFATFTSSFPARWSIKDAGPSCACRLLFLFERRPLLIKKHSSLTSAAAIVALSASLLCAGCVGRFRPSPMGAPCGEIVGEAESSGVPAGPETPEGPPIQADGDCIHRPGVSCPTGHHPMRVAHDMGHQLMRAVCLPCTIFRATLNFCAHNEAVGPPDIQAPGRFAPVPTRPVFAPSVEPAPGPEQL